MSFEWLLGGGGFVSGTPGSLGQTQNILFLSAGLAQGVPPGSSAGSLLLHGSTGQQHLDLWPMQSDISRETSLWDSAISILVSFITFCCCRKSSKMFFGVFLWKDRCDKRWHILQKRGGHTLNFSQNLQLNKPGRCCSEEVWDAVVESGPHKMSQDIQIKQFEHIQMFRYEPKLHWMQ